MKHPDLPWVPNDYDDGAKVEIEIARLQMRATIRPTGSGGRYNWEMAVCSLTSAGQAPSRASAMRAVRDQLLAVHRFLNAWTTP